MWRAATSGALVGVALLTLAPSAQASAAPVALRVEQVTSYPHDSEAYTQGLELRDDVLYEGTGLYGKSEARTVDLATGEVRQRVALPAEVFGEGLTVVGQQIWQLTYREGVAFRRDRTTLAELDRVTYAGEGWGLCHDAGRDRLVMSDGSARLTFRDPTTFAEVGSIAVTLDGAPLTKINELECVDGQVWANVFQSDRIVRIDPQTGVVEAVVDAAGLLTEAERAGAEVLNGIAAMPCADTFLITGKRWPRAFVVRFTEVG